MYPPLMTMKTSHKKNRPFDFKLIDLVEPHTILYQRQTGLSPFETMKAKNVIWEEIATQMGKSAQFCIMRWGNLRGQYQKELRHCRELCPKEGVIRGSNWPYLDRLSFLENTVQFNKPKRIRVSKRRVKAKSFEKNDAESQPPAADNVSEYTIESDADVTNDTTTMDDGMKDFISNDDFYIIEEPDSCGEEPQQPSSQKSHANLKKMSALLLGIEGENLVRIERRIMAFLCKCQLRALTNGGVDDLDV